MRLPRHPRFVHRLWARRHGLSWSACGIPSCGRYVGGHEVTDPHPELPPGRKVMMCPWCDDARRWVARFPGRSPYSVAAYYGGWETFAGAILAVLVGFVVTAVQL